MALGRMDVPCVLCPLGLHTVLPALGLQADLPSLQGAPKVD